VQHPLVRSRNTNVFLLGGLDMQAVNDRTQDGAFEDERRLGIANLGAIGDFRDEYFGGSLNPVHRVLYAGHNDIAPEDVRLRDRDHRPPHGRLLRARQRRLPAPAGDHGHDLAAVSIARQYAFQNLTARRRASLGGPRGVRAYAVGDGVGDDLFAGTIEVRQRVPGWTLLTRPIVFSAFIDGVPRKAPGTTRWPTEQGCRRVNARRLRTSAVNLTTRESTSSFRLIGCLRERSNGAEPSGLRQPRSAGVGVRSRKWS
jgi:hemolysin activation/secretion protein